MNIHTCAKIVRNLTILSVVILGGYCQAATSNKILDPSTNTRIHYGDKIIIQNVDNKNYISNTTPGEYSVINQTTDTTKATFTITSNSGKRAGKAVLSGDKVILHSTAKTLELYAYSGVLLAHNFSGSGSWIISKNTDGSVTFSPEITDPISSAQCVGCQLRFWYHQNETTLASVLQGEADAFNRVYKDSDNPKNPWYYTSPNWKIIKQN